MAAGDVTQGRRLPDGYHYRDSQPGDYWRQIFAKADEVDEIKPDMVRGRDWEWTIRDPRGAMGGLGTHEVAEHEDATITVSPSILDPDGWHGFLERGVWREV